jgi:uncharacterized lipoprotein YmbA
MKIYIRYWVLALILGVAACASTPVHYYTLLEPATATASLSPPAAFMIDVLPVDVPVQLDQPQWVVRQGDTGVAILDGVRWAGPLGDELRTAVSVQLVQRLGTQDVDGLSPPKGMPVMSIKLHVQRFDAWPGHAVQLDADWSLGFADDTSQGHVICHGWFNEVAPGGYSELARAQQRAVASLAARIAEQVSESARARRTTCLVPTWAAPTR